MAKLKKKIAECRLDGKSEVFIVYNDANLDILSIGVEGDIGRVVEIKTRSIMDSEDAKIRLAKRVVEGELNIRPFRLKMIEEYDEIDKQYDITLPFAVQVAWLDPREEV